MQAHPELYPHDDAMVWPDANGHEWFNYVPGQRSLQPITGADIVAFCTQGPQQPRPTVTAYAGADLDAYWRDGTAWRHCRTGLEWVP